MQVILILLAYVKKYVILASCPVNTGGEKMQALNPLSPSLPEPDIMEVSGYLDSTTALQVEEDVLLCIQSGAREMILDCTRLNYITGAGMRAILVMARAMQAVEGHFAVCGLQPQVKAMLAACGYDRVVSMYETRDEAIATLAA
ncbi:MAG: STAS domain-containing protein [Pseudomonadota bacterium]|nr:STAS domain-containing protein [Pseudomonadota bacterium]